MGSLEVVVDYLGLDPAKDFLVNPKMIFGRANKQVDKTTIILKRAVGRDGFFCKFFIP
jgi:hypothetical protein